MPLIAAATPVARNATRSEASRTPPEACQRIAGKRRAASAYRPTAGPPIAPSRSTSVHSTCSSPTAANPATASHSDRPVARVQPRVCTSGAPEASPRTSNGEADALGAELHDPLRDRRRLLHRRAADDDTVDAVAQQVVDHGQRTHAASDLQVDRVLARETQQQRTVRELPVARAVEIDDVQPGRAQRTVATEQLVRLEVVAGLGSEVAAQQAHAMAAAQVDRGDQQHQWSLRKLASKRAPAAPERSGWNCTPRKLSAPGDGHQRLAVVGRRDRRRGRLRGETVHEIEVLARRDAVQQRVGASQFERFQPMCGTGRPGAATSRSTLPEHAEGVGRAFGGSLEQQLHAEADAQHRLPQHRQHLVETGRTQPAHRIAGRADAGQQHARRRGDRRRVGADRRAGAEPLERELQRREVRRRSR